MELNGAVVVVTGAARGLGRAIAEAFAARGAHVALVDVLEGQLRKTAAEVKEVGGDILPIVTDITMASWVDAMAERVRREFGPADVLVNNAGRLTAIGPVWEVQHDRWFRDMMVNCWGTFLCTRAFVKDMVERRGGYVINIVGAGVDPPHVYRSGYDCSKACAIKLTEDLAEEAREFGVRAFSLVPGPVLTDMTQNIMGSPEGKKWLPWFKDIFEEGRDYPPDLTAKMAVELVSGKADHLTGRYFRTWQDFDEIIEQSDKILAQDLLTLRLRE